MRIVLFISTTRSQRSFWSVICDLFVHKINHNFPFCKQVSIFGILIMMIMTTTNSISTIILVQIKISYLVDKLFVIFCYLRTLMMMMEATTEKKADNLSATKSMLVFLCRSIYWKICCGLFFFGGQINRKKSRLLLIQPRHPHHRDYNQGDLVRPRPPVDRGSLGPRRHVCHLPGKHLLVTHRHHHSPCPYFFSFMSYHGERPNLLDDWEWFLCLTKNWDEEERILMFWNALNICEWIAAKRSLRCIFHLWREIKIHRSSCSTLSSLWECENMKSKCHPRS